MSYVDSISMILVLIFILGVILNLISVIVILKSKHFKPVSLLMLNLTLADIVYSLGIPLFVTNVFNHSWPFKQSGCQWFFLTDFMGMNVGIYTVTALSVERYIEITDKKKKMEKISDKFKLFIITIYLMLVWFTSFAFYAPIVSSIDAVVTSSNDITCETNWSQTELNSYFTIKFLFSFIIPFTLIFYSSLKIVLCLKQCNAISRNHNLITEAQMSENYKTFHSNKTKIFLKGHKAIKIVLSIVVLFFIQWTPLWLFEFYKAFQTNDFISNVHLINSIVSLVSYTNSITNPLLYVCFTHRKFIERKFGSLFSLHRYNKDRQKKRVSIISD